MNQTFTVTKDGEDITYTVLFTFFNEALNKHFVVYTDKTEDEKGNLNVFVSSYNPAEAVSDLMPLETEEEWAVAQQALTDYSEELAKALNDAAAQEEMTLEIEENENQPLTIKNGEETYTILAAFQNQENKEEYVIYVTEEEQEKEDAEVLVGKIIEKDPDGKPVKIGPIASMEEWDEIQEAVENIIDHINGGE